MGCMDRTWGWLSEDSFPEYLRKAEVQLAQSTVFAGVPQLVWGVALLCCQAALQAEEQRCYNYLNRTWEHVDMGDMGYCVHFSWWSLPFCLFCCCIFHDCCFLNVFSSHLKDHSAQAQKCLILGVGVGNHLQVKASCSCVCNRTNLSTIYVVHLKLETKWVQLEIWHLPSQNEPRVKSFLGWGRSHWSVRTKTGLHVRKADK